MPSGCYGYIDLAFPLHSMHRKRSVLRFLSVTGVQALLSRSSSACLLHQRTQLILLLLPSRLSVAQRALSSLDAEHAIFILTWSPCWPPWFEQVCKPELSRLNSASPIRGYPGQVVWNVSAAQLQQVQGGVLGCQEFQMDGTDSCFRPASSPGSLQQ